METIMNFTDTAIAWMDTAWTWINAHPGRQEAIAELTLIIFLCVILPLILLWFCGWQERWGKKQRQKELEEFANFVGPHLLEKSIDVDWAKVGLALWNVSVWSVETQVKIAKDLTPSNETLAKAAAIGSVAGVVSIVKDVSG